MADIEGMFNGQGGGSSNGVAFLVSASFVLAAIAAMCSSPQTTEINAPKRAKTLMKWVWLGEAFGLGIVVLAAVIDPHHKKAIMAGGLVTGGVAAVAYVHARNAGLRNGGEPTEDTAAPAAGSVRFF
ncbi:MAG: hypothetical protein M0030_04480 [Actinomycetota bacterium]|nr:hypothetical protein [Actinomycetota bacterium]